MTVEIMLIQRDSFWATEESWKPKLSETFPTVRPLTDEVYKVMDQGSKISVTESFVKKA